MPVIAGLAACFVYCSLFSTFVPLAYAEDAAYNCGIFVSGVPGMPRLPEAEYNLIYSVRLDIEGQKYDVFYDGRITNITASTDKHSIEFDAEPNGSYLTVRLQRALIDSTQDSRDISFTVIVNGQPNSNVTEDIVPSSGDRMVCIPLPTGDSPSRVEIIGTTIAPEFGSFAMVVASITMAGIVAFRVMSGKRPRT